MLVLLYDSLNLIVSGVELWTVMVIAHEKGIWEFCTTAVRLCSTQDAPGGCSVLLKDKIVISHVTITSNICEISKISQQYCPVTFTPMLDKNNFHFYSAPQCSHCKRGTSYGNSVCLSVRPSVRLSVSLSHAGIVSKRRHVARCSLHCRIAKCVSFCTNEKNIHQGTTPSPWNLRSNWHTPSWWQRILTHFAL